MHPPLLMRSDNGLHPLFTVHDRSWWSPSTWRATCTSSAASRRRLNTSRMPAAPSAPLLRMSWVSVRICSDYALPSQLHVRALMLTLRLSPWVEGTACNNNPKVQAQVAELGGVALLLGAL